MNESAEGVGTHHPEKPQHQEYYENGPQHGIFLPSYRFPYEVKMWHTLCAALEQPENATWEWAQLVYGAPLRIVPKFP